MVRIDQDNFDKYFKIHKDDYILCLSDGFKLDTYREELLTSKNETFYDIYVVAIFNFNNKLLTATSECINKNMLALASDFQLMKDTVFLERLTRFLNFNHTGFTSEEILYDGLVTNGIYHEDIRNINNFLLNCPI
jgi:hypothetical protein